MSVRTVTVSNGTNLTGPNRSFGCCISELFNGNTPRLFVATHAGAGVSSIQYYTYTGTNWGTVNSVANSAGDGSSGGWLSITSTNDGTRIIMGADGGTVYLSTWNGSSYSALTQVTGFTTSRVYSGVKVTGDGSRLVVIAQSSNVMWWSTWNGTTNYSTPTSVSINAPLDSNFAMTKDGNKIVYADSTNKLYVLTWTGTNYSTINQVSTYVAPTRYCALEFSKNDYVLYATNASTNVLSIFVPNSSGNNYNTRTTYTTSIPSATYNGSGIGVINKTNTSSLYIVDSYQLIPSTLYNYTTTFTAPPENITIDVGNSYLVSSSNLKVSIYDPLNISTNNVYYLYSTNGGNSYANSTVKNNGPTQSYYSFFVNINTQNINSIYVIATNTSGNSAPAYRNWVWVKENLYANTSVYINSNVRLTDGITKYSFQVNGFTNQPYYVYLRAKNTVGYSSNSEPYSVTVYTSPIASVSIDTNNTKTVASGNLQVSIIDLSNTSLNGVYYYYALNSFADTSFANTFVSAGTSPYTFFVPSITDISNTIYVRASNTIGDSSPAANLQVIVYKTPRTPPQVSFQLVSSGNVQVTIIESTSTPDNYYYLNNVSYYLYVYNTTVGGTNLSGNTSTLVYSKPVGILSNTNSSYENIVSYVNTGLNANTYTMYVIAKNPFGNSGPISGNITVYTTPDFPPKIDLGNTLSATSGNLTVSFTDLSNNPMNAISYWYYVYDPSGTNQSGNISYYANSKTTLTTGAQQSFPLTGFINKTYTLYLLSRNAVGNSVSTSTNITVYTVPTDILIDAANVKTVASGNLQVVLVDPLNGTNNGVYYQYSINGINSNTYSNASAFSIGSNAYQFYISGLTNATYTINVIAKNTVGNSAANTFSKTVFITPQYPPVIDSANTISRTSGNLTVSFLDTSNSYLNDISYGYYLYDISAAGTNNSNVPSAYTSTTKKLLNGTTQYSFQITNLVNKVYALYFISQNSVGYSSNSAPYNVTVFTSPLSTVSIDANNTKTVASGNLQVSIIDLSNTSLNGVYYQYALNSFADASFANTFVRAGTSPYTFFVPSITDISNTIYVRASNTIGNSSPAANLQVIVYKTPRTPPQVSFQLVSSGNVQVTINESISTPISYYYLNNVSYYLYVYNTTVGGTNLSGNTSTLVYSKPVGILSNTNSSYGNVVSYVNTGLNANTYTMYVIAKNPFGNSDPISSNITVYTTPDFPPKIDIGNTLSATSGNLTVSFTDPSNNPRNAISYWYYVYDPSGTNQSGNISYYANSRTTLTNGTQQSFSLYGFVNKTYTLYLLSKNVVGNSVSTSTNVTVYTVPTDILIDAANVKTVASGNLQVVLVDPSNGTNNGVYYQYSVIGINGNAYTNANAFSIGSNTYQFYIPGLTNATYTINVIAKNTVGNSAANTFSKTVFITPQYPPVIDSANTISSTSGNLTVSFLDTFNSYLNDISYSYYLYDISAAGTNNWNVPSSYISTTNKLLNGTTQYSFPITGLSNKIYALYFISQNSIGYSSNSAPYNVTVFTSPLPTVSFDTNNTKTVASGNLQVRLIDLSNTSLNGVYYQYALNSFADASFANTFVRAGTSPYTFFVPSVTDISNTIYVRASNTIGNSSPAANLQVIVYKTPRTPPQVSFQLVSSGNVQVTINESTNPPNYYYLNNVSYYLYAYNTVGGTNLSGNTSTLVYNRSVGILSNTNSSYGNVVSYVNTGLNANTYTMYVIATNPFGNSDPISSNITVYTTPDFPPKIDLGNTISATSGNLSVSFTDPSNNPMNAIYYWYYVYDPSGTNQSGNISYYANSKTTLTTGAQQSFPLSGFVNKTYTLYLLSKNVVGNSTFTSTNVTVYTVPNTPTAFDSANTITVKNSSGNLKVSFFDTSNTSLNQVYYWYSTNGTTYSNTYINNNDATITNPYTFFISPLPNIQTPIYIRATNSVGNSTPLTQTFTVLQTPQSPPYFTATLINSGNVQLTIREISRPDNYYLNGVSYYYYLYTSGVGTNLSGNLQVYTNFIGNLNNPAYPDTTSLVSGLSNSTSTFYVVAKNDVGYSNVVSANVTVYTKPNDITIDSGNTKTVASGNLRMSFVDQYNSEANGVFYKYSTDGNSYIIANTISIGNYTYQFFIPNLLNTSYTVYVIAQNDVGCTAPQSITTTVYTTPQYAPIIDTANTKSTVSGNLTVSILDSSNSVINDIYYLYSMDGVNYGNSGVAKTSGNTYQFTINNTGNALVPLIANAYSLTVAAANTVGNVFSTASIVRVYTTPIRPVIDQANTKSTTSGKLTVSIIDASNSSTNGLYYFYSTDGVTYGNSGVAKTNGTTSYTFTINNTGNALIPLVGNVYSLYIRLSNPAGNAIATLDSVNVYTTPLVPTIDIGNTKSTTSGNLTVSIIDSSNSSTNGLYYFYSTDGITYGNSGVAPNGSTSYTFTISDTGNASVPLVGNVYSLYIRLTNPTGNAIATLDSVNVYTTPLVPTIDIGNTKSTTSGNLTVSILDASNSSTNGLYYLYSTDGITYGNSGVAPNGSTSYTFTINNTGNSLVPLVGNVYSLYIRLTNPTGNAIATLDSVNVYTSPLVPTIDIGNTKSTTSGNLTVSILDASNSSTNGLYYFYSTDGITYGNSGVAPNGSTSYKFTINNTGNASVPLIGNVYSLYIRLTNPTGNAIASLGSVNVYTTPLVPTIDAGNTKSTTSGNLTVSIIDSSNSSTNGLYYFYSTDGITYGNSGVAPNGSTSYKFTINNTGNASIPLVGNVYFLYIRLTNPTGNAIATLDSVNVYTTPLVPTIDIGNTKSTTSGNLAVSIIDLSNSSTNGLYYLYSTDGITYGNSGVAPNGNTSYKFTINNTGNALVPLIGNVYSLYIRLTNPTGNAIASLGSVNVYTTPLVPTIDIGNTKSTTSGNLTVSIIDSLNSSTNGLYYLYSTDGITYGNSGVAPNGSTSYTFTINNTGNALVPLVGNVYSLYIRLTNPTGNAIATLDSVPIYTTPLVPTIDAGNTKSTTSGNLTVSIIDLSNSSTNGLYYLYSTDGITYGNSGVAPNGNTTYKFTINNTGNPLEPLIGKTYTLYIKVSNPTGNAIASLGSVNVYASISAPIIDSANTKSTNSGVLTVSIIDYYNSSTNGIYYLYSMDGISYGNSGVFKTLGNTYQFNISDTGNSLIPLVGNLYNLYIKASNPTESIISPPFPVNVYTTPFSPNIDIGNTKSTTSGNLTVSILDASNSSTNGLYYFYSTDGITYGNSGVAPNGSTSYTFTISNTGNTLVPLIGNVYSLYIRLTNPTGNAIASLGAVNVYTTPLTPTIDIGNTKSTTSGNLTVSILDASNSSTNGLYYFYSTDGITYGNSGVAPNGSTSYTFTINNTGNDLVPLVGNVYSLYIRLSNPTGNAIATLDSVNVYTTPLTPTIDIGNTKSTTSGNLTVFIMDASNSSTNGLYYFYSTDGITYGNSGVAPNGSTSYTFTINNTGNASIPLVGNVYSLYIRLTNPTGNAIATLDSVNVYTSPLVPTIDIGNTNSTTSGNLTVSILDASNSSTNGLYYFYSTDGITYGNSGVAPNGSASYTFTISDTGIASIPLVGNVYSLYIRLANPTGNAIATLDSVNVYTSPLVPTIDIGNTNSTTSGNLTVSIIDSLNSSTNGLYYLYSTDGISYGNSGVAPNGSTSYTFTISDTGNASIPLVGNVYSLYIRLNNPTGNAIATLDSVNVYTTPLVPTIDIGNTKSTTSGNLTVSILDASNSSTNGLYYFYSTDGITYGNSGVAPNGSTSYTFTINNTGNASIPLVGNVYSLYIRLTNPTGNAIASLGAVNVYTTPFSPTIDIGNTKSTTSGNLTVSIMDASNSSTNGLYYFYSTDGITYGNSGVAPNGSTSYEFTINNTGNASIPLVGNVYSLYIRLANPTGNAIATLDSVPIYTTPLVPTIDIGNTKSTTSGNLTVSIIDSSNSSTNGLYYFYSTDGIIYGNSGVALNGNLGYKFTISNTGNASIPLVGNVYSLYIRLSNPTGNAIASFGAVNVYTTPVSPSIDIGNTKSTTSGNLTVSILDASNSSTNGLYYFYSTDGITYGNSGVAPNGNTTYKFTINNTGNTSIPLIANTYSLRILASNPVGNAYSLAQTVSVYTTPLPPIIDNANTYSPDSNQLTVSFTDTSNRSINQVYYLVSIDGNVYANTGLSYAGTSYAYTYTITSGVTNGNSYIVRLKSSNPVGNSTVVSSSLVYVFTIPDPPILRSVTPQTNAIDISFSPPTFNGGTEITKYQYYLNGNTQTIANITITSQSGSINNATISSLVNGNTYTIGIRAINARGNSEWSNTQTTTPFTVPNSPSLSATAYDKYVRLFITPPTFNGGNTITGYQYSLYGNTTPLLSIVNMGLPPTVGQYLQYDVSGLINGTTYNVVVRAINARGNSEWSNTETIVPNGLPDAPILNSVIALSNSVTISYSTIFDGGSQIIGYSYSTDNGNTYTPIGNTATTYTISGLINGTSYTIRVKNENKNGISTTGSNAITVVPFTTPDSPLLLNVLSGVSQMTIVFRAPTNTGGNAITQYEYSSNGGTNFASMGIPTLDSSTNTLRYITTYQSTGATLVNGQSYSVVVRAVNSRGNSPSTNVISVTPFDVPQPPTLESATPGNETITIVYSAPANNGGNAITQYEYLLNGTRFYIENASDATQSFGRYSYVYTGLAVGGEFTVAVVAWNARGSSAPSQSFSIVPSGPPQTPTITVIPQDEYAEVSFITPSTSGNEIIRYEYSIDGGNTYANIASALPVVNGKNVFNVYNLTNGNTYTFAVRSVNSLGTSSWSNRQVVVPYTYPIEPYIVNTIPLRGRIELALEQAYNGGNTITGYKFAYVMM